MNIEIDNVKKNNLEVVKYPNRTLKKIIINNISCDNIEIFFRESEFLDYISKEIDYYSIGFEDLFHYLFSEEDIDNFVKEKITNNLERYIDEETGEDFLENVSDYLENNCSKEKIIRFINDIMLGNDIPRKDLIFKPKRGKI